MLLGPLISITSSKKTSLLTQKPNVEDLIYIKELIEADKVVSVIDRRYPLSGVAEAMRYLEEGHHHGKVVINVEHNSGA
ncbi:MAG: zinc-binding dehydrogenase [Candidatus Dadabacteria bacterium]